MTEPNPDSAEDMNVDSAAIGAEDVEESVEPKRLSLREQANAPSDTVGMGSYAALSCSIIAILVTGLLIAGLLLFRWIF